MVKMKEKHKDKPASKDSDDGIDLQSLITSLKEQSGDKGAEKEKTSEEGAKEAGSEEKSDSSFELVEEEKGETEEKTSSLDSLSVSDDTKRSRGASDEERRAFEEEKQKLEDDRRALEEEKQGHHESKNKTEEELRNVGTELLRKKEAIAKLDEQVKKKDAEQRDKEKNIKKATDLLLSQRQAMTDKEKKLDGLREELTKKAEELKSKEDRLAGIKDRTAELDAREIRIRELEGKVKERELAHKALEDQIAECPRCSSKDRFLSIESTITELKEFGIQDEQAEKDLKDMRELMDQGQREKAIELADRTVRRLKELKDGVLAKGIMYLLSSTEKNLKHAKEVGGHGEKVVDAERWLGQAKDLIQKEEYKTAEYYIKEADFLVQSVTRGVAMTAPPPTEAPAAQPESVTRNYTCPSCTTTFTIDTMERPVRITCPGCQIELIIKEDVSFA